MTHQTLPSNLNPKGYQQITDLSSASGLSIPAGAAFAYLQAEAADVRFRDDGTDPDGSTGMILYAGAQPMPYIGNLSQLSFIDDTSGAILNVLYYALGGN